MSERNEDTGAGRRRIDGVDPDFDGHLERPLTEMSPKEKLDWLWQMHLLDVAARRDRGERGPEPRD